MSQEFEPNGDGEDRINQQMDEIMSDTPKADKMRAVDAIIEEKSGISLIRQHITLHTECAELRARIAELEEDLKDRDETFKRIVANDTAKDEIHCGCCVELRARVRELTEPRPIDTAPEGENVLLYCPERHFTNPERWELGIAYGNGSAHAWATGWLPLPTSKGESNE